MTTSVATAAGAAELHATSIGYLVPARDFAGVVHSVFAHACNVALPGSLLTLVARRDADAPTSIVLRHDPPPDLRLFFRRGMALNRQGAWLVGTGVTVSLAAAGVWSRGLRAAPLEVDRIRDNVAFVRDELDARAPSASPMACVVKAHAAALEAAARTLDSGSIEACTSALVGLGEGLTPSGDDFLVGMLAGLELLVDGAARQRFLDDLRRAVEARLSATADLSAFQLRLATGGHFSGALDRLRSRIVAEPHAPFVASALQRALDFGATSGADSVRGLLAALRAWLPPADGEAAA